MNKMGIGNGKSRKKIIMAESLAWNSLYRVGSHYYAGQFLNHNFDVCWVTNPISPFHRFSSLYKKHADELREKYALWRKGGFREKNFFYYAPLTLLPFGKYPVLQRECVLNNTLRATIPPLARFLRRNDFSSVNILWFTNPAMVGLLSMVRPERVIFRIADDIAAFDEIPDVIKKAERRIVDLADIVFVTAKTIMNRYAWAGDKIHYLPNGVDFGFFQAADDTLPEEYRGIPGPRIVYVGALAGWFDVDLLRVAALRNTNYSFILIGEPRINLSSLSLLKNVHILGPRRHGIIPAYLKNADVGIIPFKNNRLVDSINPIKLYEYMACGLPVVATKWKTLETIESPAFLAGSPEEFSDLLKMAVQTGVGRERALEFARANSWEKRFHMIRSIIG